MSAIHRRHVPPLEAPDPCLIGGGSMGALIRAHDWAATPLGPVERWPQSLKSAVSILLPSKAQIVLFWGPDLTAIYNDAYAPAFGAKHPWALGRPARECWSEVWHILGPLFRGVLETGEAFWAKDHPFFLHRRGFLEETYFDVSYDPVRAEDGGVGGVFCIVSDQTGRVLGERRLDTLRELGSRTAGAGGAADVARGAAAALADDPADVPFALVYLTDAAGERAELVGVAGVAPDAVESGALHGDPAFAGAWQGEPGAVDAARLLREPPDGAADQALVLPISGGTHVAGVLVAGVSRFLRLEADYRAFFDMIATSVSAALATARAHEAERRRAEALAEIDRAKTAFFGNVSHEFRTPLTLLLGPLEDAVVSLGPGPVRDALEVAQRNAGRLLKLVNTLLDFTRIEAGRIEAVYEPLDLPAFTAELASLFRSAIERAGLRLEVHGAPLPAPVHVDRDMWEKIVLNLLSNALKYTFEGVVSVSVCADGGHAVLEVRDTGIGIAPEDQAHVFERFHRVRGARGRTQEGTGIGLSLVRELVRLHGGVVALESEPGRGSVFTVRVPFGTAHLPADRIGAPRLLASTAIGAQPYLEEARRWVEPEARTEAPARIDAATAGARVLVGDDNADMRDYLRRLLGEHWTVETAPDGVRAVEQALERPPDLVLADVMMPGRDGFEVLRALRKDERTRTVPVILLSARAGEESRVEGLDAGADDYLVKPFSARELVSRVNAHLALARLRREAAERARQDAEVIQQERLRAEALVAELTDFFDNAVIPIHWVGADGVIMRANRAELEMLGYREDEFVGRPIADFDADSATIADMLSRLGAGESLKDFPARLRCKDGSIKHVLIDSNVRWEGGRFVNSRCFTRDVTDLRRAEAELSRLLERERAARAEAEAANRSKDEFLAVLSHELRTPLNAVLGWARILGTTHQNPEIVRRAVETIERNAQLQAQLIDDLLDVSRIIAGKLAIDAAPVDLAAVIDDAVQSVGTAAAAKGVTLSVDSAVLPPLVGDAARLQQVVWNLLSNALKFTPRGGRVTVRLRGGDDDAEIAVTDTGRGIEAKFLPHVFERFRQADSSTTRGEGGLGLGLAIVSHIVERHGGTVRADSGGPGTGATFTVRLPRRDPPSVPADGERRPALRAAARAPASPLLSGVSVLLVEDDPDSREMVATALGDAGASVTAVASVRQALASLEKAWPHVVVSDISMPEEDGYQLVQRIRALPGDGRPRLSAIALTAYARPEDRLKSLLAGFDVHIAKPVDPIALSTVVARLAGVTP
jgi:PAS domain S-box-containing protein